MRRTQKYLQALAVSKIPHDNQEQLYAELNKQGYFWNQNSKKWECDETPPNPANELIRIRVWAASSKVERIAELVLKLLKEEGLNLIEKSNPYQNRPPNQNDSRVYLTFDDASKD